jgi:hypothetical protein
LHGRRQHTLHDAVAINDQVNEGRSTVDPDKHKEKLLSSLVQAIDILAGRGIVGCKHRQGKQIKK